MNLQVEREDEPGEEQNGNGAHVDCGGVTVKRTVGTLIRAADLAYA